MQSENRYPVLADGCSLRLLEEPYVFDADRDQLYEIDREALDLLLRCNGVTSMSELKDSGNEKEVSELIDYMIGEELIKMRERKIYRTNEVHQSLIPSLRYLLVHTTTRCNLTCKHCYLGDSRGEDIDIDIFRLMVDEFRHMGGLKIMLSGGEPLLHPLIWDFLAHLRSSGLRVVMLSNGTLIDRNTARRLAGQVHEVQVSIDGTQSHHALRGAGTLDKTLDAVRYLNAEGVDVSVASMIHARNLDEFMELEALIRKLGAVQWSVDIPCVAGHLVDHPDWIADLSGASRIFSSYGFGDGTHESTGHYTCGTHLCTIMPNGDVARCGFFEDEPAGNITTGLAAAWTRLSDEYLWDLDMLDCAACPIISECHGGCRYRAKQWGGSIFSPDPVMCLSNNIDPCKMLRKEVIADQERGM